MPRFYFDVHDDLGARDEEGQELTGDEAAMAQAAIYARDMAAESVRTGHLDRTHYIELRNAAGESLCRVTYGEAVRIAG